MHYEVRYACVRRQLSKFKIQTSLSKMRISSSVRGPRRGQYLARSPHLTRALTCEGGPFQRADPEQLQNSHPPYSPTSSLAHSILLRPLFRSESIISLSRPGLSSSESSPLAPPRAHRRLGLSRIDGGDTVRVSQIGGYNTPEAGCLAICYGHGSADTNDSGRQA